MIEFYLIPASPGQFYFLDSPGLRRGILYLHEPKVLPSCKHRPHLLSPQAEFALVPSVSIRGTDVSISDQEDEGS